MALGIDFSSHSVSFLWSERSPDPLETIATPITLDTDIVQTLMAHAGLDDVIASEAATAIGRRISVALSNISLDGMLRPERTAVSVPVSVGPIGRAALAEGLTRAGVPVSVSDMVSRPVAAYAAWSSEELCSEDRVSEDRVSEDRVTEDRVTEDRGVTLLILNDRRNLSALMANTESQTLLAQTPLTASPFQSFAAVRTHLVDLARALPSNAVADLVEIRDWAAVSAQVSQIVLIGQPTEDEELPDLCAELFPAATLARTPDITLAVAAGLHSLGTLNSWRAAWPTGITKFGGRGLRRPGPVLEAEEVTGHPSEPGSSDLTFCDASGVPFPVAAGTVVAEGITLPSDLRSSPRICFLPDGRLLVLPAQALRPLTVQLGWPIPGSGAATVRLTSLGRRAAQLINPKVLRPHPTTVPS